MLEFDSPFQPAISVREYMDRISTYLHCTFECYVLAFALLERLEMCSSVQLSPTNIHRFMLISTRVASKYLDDQHYQNSYYAKIGGVAVDEFNHLELAFLYALAFRLYVSEDQFQRMYIKLWSTRSLFIQNQPDLVAKAPPPSFSSSTHRQQCGNNLLQPLQAGSYGARAGGLVRGSMSVVSSGLAPMGTHNNPAALSCARRPAISSMGHSAVGVGTTTVAEAGMGLLARQVNTTDSVHTYKLPMASPSRSLRRTRSMGDREVHRHLEVVGDNRALRRTQSLGPSNAGEQLAATANSVASAVLGDLFDSDDTMFDEDIGSPVSSSPSSVRGLRWLDPQVHVPPKQSGGFGAPHDCMGV